jgi:hypothetical protein
MIPESDPPLARFEHPGGLYSLEFPAAWEHRVEDRGERCGFGPRERDNVGLWISVLPVRIESELATEELGRIFQEALAGRTTHVERDHSLRHYSLKGSTGVAGDGGSLWLVAGGRLVLFATTQFPAGERGTWEPRFAAVLASIEISGARSEAELRVTRKLVERLRERFPDQEFDLDGDQVRSGGMVLLPGNVVRNVLRDPESEEALIADFFTNLSFIGDDAPSNEKLDSVRSLITPLLKPKDFLAAGGWTTGIVHSPWLSGLVTCYAVEGTKTWTFVLEKDLARWGISREEVHRIAVGNLAHFGWPGLPAGRRREAPLILIDSGGRSDSRRILDPNLHAKFAPLLGEIFFAGVPERDSLVLIPRTGTDRKRAAEAVREHFEQSTHPLTAALFTVSARGVEEAKGSKR